MKKKITIISWLLAGSLFMACNLPFTLTQPRPPASTVTVATETVLPTSTAANRPIETTAPIGTVTQSAPEAPVVTVAVLLPFVSGQTSPPAPAPEGNHYYIVQVGTPLGTANFIHPEAGCNWAGIGGQVFDLKGEAVTGLVVQVGGVLSGAEFLSLGITGNSPALGEGGYEVKLADHPIATNGTLWVQLFDVSGNPLSHRIFIETFDVCDHNFILLNFTEVQATIGVPVYLPVVIKK
jgi:hypothetical protein